MIHLVVSALFVISLPAFGAANLAAPAKKAEAKVIKAAKASASGTKLHSKSSGRSSMALGAAITGSKKVKILPTIGFASFRMQGLNLEGFKKTSADDGLNLGVLADYDYGPVVFQGGLSYLQLGAKASHEVVPVSITAKMDYLAVTLAAKKYFAERQVYLKGGFIPMFNMRSDYEYKGPIPAEIPRKGKADNIRDMDVIAQVGGGMEFQVSPTVRLGGELTFNRGLIDVTTAGNGEVFNEGFLLSGYVSL